MLTTNLNNRPSPQHFDIPNLQSYLISHHQKECEMRCSIKMQLQLLLLTYERHAQTGQMLMTNLRITHYHGILLLSIILKQDLFSTS